MELRRSPPNLPAFSEAVVFLFSTPAATAACSEAERALHAALAAQGKQLTAMAAAAATAGEGQPGAAAGTMPSVDVRAMPPALASQLDSVLSLIRDKAFTALHGISSTSPILCIEAFSGSALLTLNS